jgi:hypothetical protein
VKAQKVAGLQGKVQQERTWKEDTEYARPMVSIF